MHPSRYTWFWAFGLFFRNGGSFTKFPVHGPSIFGNWESKYSKDWRKLSIRYNSTWTWHGFLTSRTARSQLNLSESPVYHRWTLWSRNLWRLFTFEKRWHQWLVSSDDESGRNRIFLPNADKFKDDKASHLYEAERAIRMDLPNITLRVIFEGHPWKVVRTPVTPPALGDVSDACTLNMTILTAIVFWMSVYQRHHCL